MESSRPEIPISSAFILASMWSMPVMIVPSGILYAAATIVSCGGFDAVLLASASGPPALVSVGAGGADAPGAAGAVDCPEAVDSLN